MAVCMRVWVGGVHIWRIMHIITVPTRNSPRPPTRPPPPPPPSPPQFQNIIIPINSIFNFSYNLNPFYSLPFTLPNPPPQNHPPTSPPPTPPLPIASPPPPALPSPFLFPLRPPHRWGGVDGDVVGGRMRASRKDVLGNGRRGQWEWYGRRWEGGYGWLLRIGGVFWDVNSGVYEYMGVKEGWFNYWGGGSVGMERWRGSTPSFGSRQYPSIIITKLVYYNYY